MALEPAPAVRFVRCPKCFNVLPEPTGIIAYECGVCSTRLRARGFNVDADQSKLKASTASDSIDFAATGSASMTPERGADLSSSEIRSTVIAERDTVVKDFPPSPEEIKPDSTADYVRESLDGTEPKDLPIETTKEEVKPTSDVLSTKNWNIRAARKASTAYSKGRTRQYKIDSETLPLHHVEPSSDFSYVSSPVDPGKRTIPRFSIEYYDDGMSSNDGMEEQFYKPRGSLIASKFESRKSGLMRHLQEDEFQRRQTKQHNPPGTRFGEGSSKSRHQLQNESERSFIRYDNELYLKNTELEVYMKMQEIQELLRTSSLRHEMGSSSEWGSPSVNWRRPETPNFYNQGKTAFMPTKWLQESSREKIRAFHMGAPMYGRNGPRIGGEEQSYKPKVFEREKQNTVKQYVRSLSGAAPFVACTACLKPLLLPSDFLLFERRCHKVLCGACGEVLRFSLVDSKQLVPYKPISDELEKMSNQSNPKALTKGIRLHELLGYSSLSQIVSRRIASSLGSSTNGRHGKGKYG